VGAAISLSRERLSHSDTKHGLLFIRVVFVPFWDTLCSMDWKMLLVTALIRFISRLIVSGDDRLDLI
jgi:hypothetical protein